MKKYPFLEAIGTADEKFLEEVFEDNEHERRKIYMSKKKLVTIMIAAALIVALGVTAVATGWSRLNQLGDYFEWNKEILRLPEELPVIDNPEVYVKEVVTSAVTDETEAAEDAKAVGKAEYTHPAPGTAQITTVSMAGRSIYMTIEFNAEGLDIPPELPEDARQAPDEEFFFEWADTNFIWSGGRGGTISRNGDIFTIIFSRNNIFALPEDEIVIKLQRFGYLNADKHFVTLRDIEVEVRLPVSEINVMEPLKSKNTVEIMNAEFGVELSAYDMVIYSDIDSLFAAGLVDSEGLGIGDDPFGFGMDEKPWTDFNEGGLELHMLDGTVFTEHPFANGGSHLITSKSGFRDVEKGRIAEVWSWEVPIDIAQIDYIVLNGNRFDFASAE